MEKHINKVEGVLAQIKGAKGKAFREAVKVAAENLAEDAVDESEDIGQTLMDFQMILHRAYSEIIHMDGSFFKAQYEYHPKWFRTYEAFQQHHLYPTLVKGLIDIGIPWKHGELILIGAYQQTMLDIVPLQMASYEAADKSVPVTYISLDRKWEDLRDELLAIESNLSLDEVKEPVTMTVNERIKLEAGLCAVTGNPLYFTRMHLEDFFELAMELKNWVEETETGIVFIESIRRLEGFNDEPVEDNTMFLKLTGMLKSLAEDLNIAIVVGAELPMEVCNVPEERAESYSNWQICLECFAAYADHALLISPNAICDPRTNFTDGEMVIAKCHGNFTRNVVYL